MLAVLAAPSAFAAQIFVAGSDPNAADKNPGTEQSPLRTIQAGVDAARPGDTIWVKAGDYEDLVHISKPGEYNAPITLERLEGRSRPHRLSASRASHARQVVAGRRKQVLCDQACLAAAG